MARVWIIFPLLLVSIISFKLTIGFQYVVSKKGSCLDKKGSALIKMNKEACRKIGGRYSKTSSLVDCYLDWCKVPYSGGISHSTVYTICGSDEQSIKTYRHTPIQDFRPYGVFEMRGEDCKAINGRVLNGKPRSFSMVACYVKLCPFSGNNRYELKGMVLSAKNECSQLVSASTLLSSADCRSMVGSMSQMRVVGNSKGKCYLDVCEVL